MAQSIITKPAFATRVHVLDVLRGIALCGMIVAHFSYQYIYKSPKWIDDAMNYFVHGKFYTLFAILFGASFTILFMNIQNKHMRISK